MPEGRSSYSFRPFGDPGRQRYLHPDELAAVYDSPEAGPDSMFRWDGAPYAALIVSAIGHEHCLAVLRTGSADRFLVESGPAGDATVTMQGARVAVPRAAVLPRRYGLEALQGVGDLERLQAAHAWREVPRWPDDPLYARLGDRVEDLLDAAFELVLADPHGDPAGLRHVGNLMLLHNTVMSGGVGKARSDRSPQFVEAAADGAEYLGLPDLAAVIRRIHTDRDSGWRLAAQYYAYSGPFADDAGTIRAAVARRVDAAPHEFG
ncbi:hypothetical protein ACPPVO_10755 [Dactylosporangium sp. McL0621]|uniref:hypothetical protein n=1 Tax=Dactylosporangium sp. McL0621 TaxID=3415678 RepID=UPI003CEE7F66